MQPIGLTLLLQLFLVLTLLSSAILARPFTDDQLLQNFIDESAVFRQPVAYSKFEKSDSMPYYRAGIKRQLQAFADPPSKQKAAHMMRAMLNFRRY